MDKRLRVARQLLSDKGVIFISIDDNEDAPLRMLCDDIFGIDCFAANISWQRTYSARNDSKGIVTEVEHLLVYSRLNTWSPKKLPRTAEMDAKYKNPDNDVAMWRTSDAFAPGAVTHQGMVYAIQHPFTGKLIYPSKGACWRYQQDTMLEIMQGWCEYELKELDDASERAKVCGITADEVRKGVKAIMLSESLEISAQKAQTVYDRGQWPRFFFTKGGKGGIARKTYLDNVGGKLPSNFWPYSEVGHTDEAKKELLAIFPGKAPFDTPKPTRLMERILQIASADDSIILDFFAGSGTTAHGVLKYNVANPKSKRSFILCTNNESGICENVTYPRVKTVITGKRTDGSNYADGIPANIKYYRTDFVSKDDEYLSDALLEHIREMIQLEHGVKIDGSRYLMVMSDEEADELQAHWSEYEGVKAIYASKDILFTTEQNALFAGVEIHTIPDYYFNFELKEVGETW